MKVLIASVSSRSEAHSAVAAGYEVISLDFFGDSDYPDGVEVYSLVRDFQCEPSAKGLAGAVERLADRADAVVIGSGLENEPALLEVPVKGKRWYNSAEAVRGVRDLRQVQGMLHALPVKIPQIITPAQNLPQSGRWLVKDARHSGGVGVQAWDGCTRLGPSQMLEEYIPGELGSASFVADGKHAILIGLSRQYAGVAELNGPTYAWCGNVVPWGDKDLVEILSQATNQLTSHFGLVGLNGIDYILRDGVPYLIEINPRPCGSGELFEHLLGINLFQLHIDGCQGRLPEEIPAVPIRAYWGKGILYAPRELVVENTKDWKGRGIADIPHPGERIPAGAPVCTLLASAATLDSCWNKVLETAITLESELINR